MTKSLLCKIHERSEWQTMIVSDKDYARIQGHLDAIKPPVLGMYIRLPVKDAVYNKLWVFALRLGERTWNTQNGWEDSNGR